MTKLKWCIKRTPENFREVNEWANKNCPNRSIYNSVDYFINSESDGYIPPLMSFKQRPDFHEITIDEFRLLTDPEKYYSFSILSSIAFQKKNKEYANYCKSFATFNDEPDAPVVSEPVFKELQRMWKKRDEIQVKNTVGCSFELDAEVLKDLLGDNWNERERININKAWLDESNEVTSEMLSNLSKNRGTNSIKDRGMIGIMGLLPNPKFHVDDFKTKSEKEIIKLLKKINRKLNRILKQKEQF